MSLMLKARTKIFLLFVILVMWVLGVFNYAIFSITEQDWQEKKMSIMKSDMHAMVSKEEAMQKYKDAYIAMPDWKVEFQSGIFSELTDIRNIAAGDTRKVGDRYYTILPDLSKDGSLVVVADDVTDVVGTKFELVERARIFSAIALVIVSVLAFLFTWYVFRPIRALAKKAEIFDGHQSLEQARIGMQWDPKDEIILLANSLDGMFARIIRDTGRLEQFSDDLAHEFKNRLFELRSTLELAKRNNAYQQAIDRVWDETTALWDLVDKLLLFARLENPILPAESINIPQLVESLFPNEMNRIDIWDSSHHSWLVDPELFGTVLFNLIGNALRYSELSSRVMVRVTDHQITIVDHGYGISPEHLPYIFDRFYKVDNARAHGTGHGLGLSIAQKIVEAHGFWLSIQSELHRGTTITIENNKPSS